MTGRTLKSVPITTGICTACAGLFLWSKALAADDANYPGAAEYSLMTTAFYLMLIIVVPVLVLTVLFAYRFRASNDDSKYDEYLEHSALTEITVWLVPGILITALGILVWTNTHRLDPYRSIDTTVEPTSVQAIALDWKWLFIYPEQGIATINELVFPADRPLSLSITSDVALNSFIVQELGGQIYAMAGMETQLHLKAGETGQFEGRNMQYSGDGFPDQTFSAIAMSTESFENWISRAKDSTDQLTQSAFEELQKDSVDHPVTYYSQVMPNLFHAVLSSHRNPVR